MKFNTVLVWSGIFVSALSAPGAASTSTVWKTTTSTVTTGSASTAYTFLPGNPPSSTPAVTVTSTVTELTTAKAPATTSTLYPCASPFPSRTPTLPYGDATPPSNLSTQNTLFYVSSTSQGASAQACCNACFFELANCIQAYWYSYEGCVVSQATNSSLTGSASGEHVGKTCPAGTFKGLTYEQDTNPAFRSTGNIAGPCGQTYNNL